MSEHGEEYRQLCRDRGWVYWLERAEETDVTQAQPQAEAPIEPFSEESFLDHLVQFITTGDQV